MSIYKEFGIIEEWKVLRYLEVKPIPIMFKMNVTEDNENAIIIKNFLNNWYFLNDKPFDLSSFSSFFFFY